MAFARDVLGYVHCYANLNVDKKSAQEARDKLACIMMDTHNNFFGLGDFLFSLYCSISIFKHFQV